MSAWFANLNPGRVTARLGGRSRREFLRSMLSYFCYSVLGSLLGFLTIPYLTRQLGPEEFGQIGMFMSLTYVLGPMVSFSAIGLVGINKTQLDEAEFARFKGGFIAFGCCIFVVLQAAGLVAALLMPQFAVIAIASPFISFVRFLTTAHGAELVQMRQPSKFGLLNSMTSLLTLVATVAFISGAELSWTGRILAIAAAETTFAVLRYAWFPASPFTLDFRAGLERAGGFVRFGAPLLVGLGAAWLFSESSKFLILHFYSLKEVGMYTVPAMLGLVIHTINEAMSNTYYPRMAAQLRDGTGYRAVRRYFVFYGLFALGLAGAMTLMGYTVFDTLFGTNFPDSAPIIAFISLSYGFAGMNRTVAYVLTFFKKSTLQTAIWYVGAIVNILLSVALMPTYGVVAPAIGTALAYLLVVVLNYRAAFREMRLQGIHD